MPEKPLRPADPYWRARMRIWTKFVDEYMCPAISYMAWHHFIHNITDQLTPEEFEEKLQQIPLKEQQDKWRISAKQGYTKQQLDDWARQVQTSYEQIEPSSRRPSGWLVISSACRCLGGSDGGRQLEASADG